MADGLSNAARASMLDALFAGYTTVTVALFVGEPLADGTGGTEATGANLARASTTPAQWTAATSADPSVKNNSALIDFGTASGDLAGLSPITHVGLYGDNTTYLGCGTLASTKIVNSGDDVQIAIGGAVVNLSY